MPSCVVKWCRSYIISKCPGISFHSFPSDEVRRSKWIDAVRLERQDRDWMPTKASKVCSIHFKDNEYDISPKGYHMLKKTAVPVCTMVRIEKEATTIPYNKSKKKSEPAPLENATEKKQLILVPVNCDFTGMGTLLLNTINEPLNLPSSSYAEENKIKKRKPEKESCYECTEGEPNTTKIAKDEDVNLNNLEYKITLCPTPLNIPSSDSSVESVLDSPITYQLKQKLKQKTLLAQKRLSKIKTLQRKNKRLALRNISLKNIISELKKKGFGDSNQNTALGEFSDDIVLARKQKRSKKGRSNIKYTPSMKNTTI